jgi:hypothetical protein
MSEKEIFYCDPVDLLTPLRFDISAKHYYAKNKDKRTKFPKDLYAHHIEVWNNFSEYGDPSKQNKEDFINQFNNIIESIKETGFNQEKSLIPIHREIDSPLNGAHRLAASIVHNKKVACYRAPDKDGQLDCSYYFLRSREENVLGGLNKQYADFMALNYAKLKKNSFIVTLFPSALDRINEARDIVFRRTSVVYEKPVYLENFGPFNFIRTLYDGEPWAGNWQVGFQGVLSKVQQCYPRLGPTYVFLVQTDDPQILRSVKEEIRSLYNVGNHSVHINDYHNETVRIASCVFNNNSVHFVNNSEPKYLKNFETYFSRYRNWLSRSNYDTDEFCVDASAILSAYGLRDCRDLDFLYGGKHIESGIHEVNCHNEELKYYLHHKDDIIFNPSNHFYHLGLKFATLDVLGKMKNNRAENKDFVDLQLIKRILP